MKTVKDSAQGILDYLKEKGLRPFLGSFENNSKRKVTSYLRLYTDLVIANEMLNEHYYKEAIEYLNRVRKLTKSARGRSESRYLRKIDQLISYVVKDLIKHKKRARLPHNRCKLRINLQTAQGICILRILSECK